MTFDFGKIAISRDEVAADIKNLQRVLGALDVILEQAPATKSGKKRNLWHDCPLGCPKKHRKNDPHMQAASVAA